PKPPCQKYFPLKAMQRYESFLNLQTIWYFFHELIVFLYPIISNKSMIYPQNFEQKIGFDQIRQLLKDKCLSTLGEERVSEMSFSGEYEEVEEKLNQVTEFVRIIQEEDSFPD